MARKRSVYIGDTLYKRCENIIKENNPAFLEEAKENKSGYYSRIVRHVLTVLLNCYDANKDKLKNKF